MTTAPSAARAPRTWFITGAGRGLGRAFTEAALAAGDRVAAASRDITGLEELAAHHEGRLLPLRLDVTDRAAVLATVAAAADHFDGLDIVVNNAGVLATGMVEEFTEAEARAHLDVNFFAALWVTQAVIPVLRARGRGHLVQMSSIGGVTSMATTGLYSAGKFALEGMSEALAGEVAGFGVKVTIVEPGGYWTDLYANATATTPDPAYAGLRAELERLWAEGSVDSEPRLAAEALLTLVDSDDPPLRLILGGTVYDAALAAYRRRMETWAAWEPVTRAAEHAAPAPSGQG
ncbi:MULTISPECIES: SDR family NAD(P)-dependent oxidoreductase [Streptomycetaceae]|uniref:Short chain dehydrogenase n=1 Tax=Streptantibioticus cattleyicolor (strain ATCC 35852 / DSM 46488 / JCM 4925 / NBRC 14057 / NRRL 8057) TaxID=1003195 RepID=F8K1X6_STREN|nr:MULTISPECIES: SDR family NAD(P)-dependent oxidoreductase [Streptomycetaceae]AEW92453.1 short chain dehydrogenase [Streptantibioticus cattleyicolor NRRL 8057 = DSM 46488]MYS57260.1 SDR family NAD(P)-dependent oxidoreductase [Streptomyces sp. SID5468]CCB72817.1 Short-chain dehydrogenase/reductase SDR [Streptantibioticus cattleyicolor NRRL 8057 = DSM 46488]